MRVFAHDTIDVAAGDALVIVEPPKTFDECADFVCDFRILLLSHCGGRGVKRQLPAHLLDERDPDVVRRVADVNCPFKAWWEGARTVGEAKCLPIR